MTNINEEMQNVNVTISVPVKDIAGLVAIDYDKLTSKVYDELDMSSIASDVIDNIDFDDLIDKLDMDDIASSLKDSIDISDYIDTSDVASNAADMIDVEEKVQDLLSSYDPANGCALGESASKAMINAIRYDIMCHLYGQDKSKLDVTITDVLRKFIKQEILAKQEEEELSKYMANNEQDNKNFTLNEVYQILSKASDMNQNLLGSLIGDFNKFADNKATEQITIKAD